MAAAAVTGERLELDDMQGLLVRGYGALRSASFLLYAIDDAPAARRFLAALEPRLTRASERRPSEVAINIAVTSAGLERLGLPPEAVETLPFELRDGMVTAHRRRILGDTGVSAPERWSFGGPATPVPHLLVLAYARDDARLGTLVHELAEQATGGGLSELRRLETHDIGDIEHFGFRDGISQPRIAGLGDDDGPPDASVRAGEFVLGYRNEYGLYAPRPLVRAVEPGADVLAADIEGSGMRDLGRNGSYLVLRQLEQDVAAFWRFADHAAGGDPAARVRIASRLVGRWPGGAPLVLSPELDDPALAHANVFRYHDDDAVGLRCPIGAHVRRTNPRDSLDPSPGSDASVAVGKRHRLLRRGREYGQALSADDALRGAPETDARGLHFICLNSNISRQFEFIQQTWVNSPKFGALYDEPDPLLTAGGSFSIPASPVRRRLTDLPRFVTVRGGAYLLLPGLGAVRYLARSAPA